MIRIIPIKQLAHDKEAYLEDSVAVEYPLTLYLNGEEWITMLCSPDSLEYLICGFLKSEGLIKKHEDLTALTIDQEKGHAWITLDDMNPLMLQLHGKRTQTSGCAKGITFYQALDTITLIPSISDLKVKFADLSVLMAGFNGSSPVFKATGGVHSCAICSTEEMIFLQEDIGRHNALDKLIGEAMIKGLSLTDKILLTSGRVSSEILLKSARAGLSLVASRSAPTDLAVREAEKLGMTLVGFLRGNRCNIYAGEQRIVMD